MGMEVVLGYGETGIGRECEQEESFPHIWNSYKNLDKLPWFLPRCMECRCGL